MKKSSIILASLLLAAGANALSAKSPKRGVSENQFQYKAQMAALEQGVSWYYNWSAAPGRYLAGESYFEFVPMCWNGNYSADNIRSFVADHPEAHYLLAFNEPNFKAQANMTPAQAAAAWPAVQALAQELNLEIVAPALNYSPDAPYYSPTDWMDEFVSLVGTDAFDYTAVHAYGGLEVTKTICTNFHEKYGKPVWLTEFCYWPDEGNSNSTVAADTQIYFMMQTVEWLEKTDWIYRYAWFKAIGDSSASTGPNYGLLLSGKGENERELSEQGKVYVNLSEFDANSYHATNIAVPAAEYYSQSGALLGSTHDESCTSPIEITRFNSGAYLDYQFEVPQAGEYNLTLRVSGVGEPTRFDPTVAVYTVAADGTETLVSAARQFELSNDNTVYTEETFPMTLNAGKQTIRLKDGAQYSPSGIHISTLTLTDAAGIDGISADKQDGPVNVYSLQGILLRSNVSAANPLADLPSGIYIVNNRKLRK
jgi:hypothetical protein